jgi:hypothetical protein
MIVPLSLIMPSPPNEMARHLADVMRTPTTREELLIVLRERNVAANRAVAAELTADLHPVQWRDFAADFGPIIVEPTGPPNRKQRRALARRNPTR